MDLWGMDKAIIMNRFVTKEGVEYTVNDRMIKPSKKPALNLMVRVFDAKTDKMEREVTKVINSVERRQWIVNLILWACLNDKFVEMVSVENDHE